MPDVPTSLRPDVPTSRRQENRVADGPGLNADAGVMPTRCERVVISVGQALIAANCWSR